MAGLAGFWSDLTARHPAGHRPGIVRERVVRELASLFRPDASRSGHLLLSRPEREDLAIEVRERVERHFLMHLVGVEVALAIPAPPRPGLVIDIRNSGMFRRTGLVCRSSGQGEGIKELLAALEKDAALNEALLILDFRRVQLRGGAEGWEALVEPYGACEVVNRMPAFRRYIKLGPNQVPMLARALIALRRVVRSQNREGTTA